MSTTVRGAETRQHVMVEAIPRTRCDSSSDSEKIIDRTITLEDKQTLTEEEIIAKKKAARPFAGKGRPLSEVIPECWRNWTHMMKGDAKNGFIDAQVDYALALWRGDVNMKINVDRKAAYRWIAKAVTYGQHCLYARGGCGASNCHKCHAIILKKKMEEWFKDEEIRAKCASQFVTLHTPSLIFQILAFCDAETLMSMRQLNLFWSSVIADDRAWAHLDMHTLYPAPDINFELLAPPHLQCKVCKQAITAELPRYEAIMLPHLFERHFAVCKSCFESRAGGIIVPYTLHGAKLLQLQWELKDTATQQLYWEKHAERKLEIPGGSDARVVNSVKVAGMSVPSKAGGIYTEAKAQETRTLQAVAVGMRTGLNGVEDAARAIQRHTQKDTAEAGGAQSASAGAAKAEVERAPVAKVVRVVEQPSIGKSVMAAVSAKPRRQFEEGAGKGSSAVPESDGEEDEDDEEDLAMLAQMLIAGEDITLITDKDKEADRRWQEEEEQRIREEQARLRRETEAREALQAAEDERDRVNTANALALVQHIHGACTVEGEDEASFHAMSEEHTRAETLAEYIHDFSKHRKHISSWNLENQVMVVYPTHSCSLFKQGDAHDGNFNHTDNTRDTSHSTSHDHSHDTSPAMPLLYELLGAQWARARGYRYLKLRNQIRMRLLNVLAARDRGEEAVFYTIKKRKEV